MIPRILHRIRLGTDHVPGEATEWARKWKSLHPSWLHVLWTPQNMPALQNRALFNRCSNFGHQSDILRYEILYHFGGVCVDLDMEPLDRLDPLLELGSFVGQIDPVQHPQGLQSIETSIIGTRPRHPFFAHLVQNLDAWATQRRGETSSVPIRTGALYFETQLMNWNRGEEQPVSILPPKNFYPARDDQPGIPPSRVLDAYAIHHEWKSWAQAESAFGDI